MRYTLPKAERITKVKDFNLVFTQGKQLTLFPIKAYYIIKENLSTSVKVAFIVPKNKIKLAVDRNYLKRLMRESYRKHKHYLFEDINNNKEVLLAFVYIATESFNYNKIEQTLCLILQEINKRFTLQIENEI